MIRVPLTLAQRAEHYAKTIAWLDEHGRAAAPEHAEVFARASRKMAARAAAALQPEARNDRS